MSEELARAVGHPVAIVDINDRGGSVRHGATSGDLPDDLRAVLADNPMGQRDRSTPIVVVRLRSEG